MTPQERLEPHRTYDLVDLSVEGFADSEWDVEDEGGDMTAGAIAARLGLHSMTIVLLVEESSPSTLTDMTDADDFETLASSDSDTSCVFGQDDDDHDDDSLSSDESDE